VEKLLAQELPLAKTAAAANPTVAWCAPATLPFSQAWRTHDPATGASASMACTVMSAVHAPPRLESLHRPNMTHDAAATKSSHGRTCGCGWGWGLVDATASGCAVDTWHTVGTCWRCWAERRMRWCTPPHCTR
jgi:hypothetical protein